MQYALEMCEGERNHGEGLQNKERSLQEKLQLYQRLCHARPLGSRHARQHPKVDAALHLTFQFVESPRGSHTLYPSAREVKHGKTVFVSAQSKCTYRDVLAGNGSEMNWPGKPSKRNWPNMKRYSQELLKVVKLLKYLQSTTLHNFD